MNPRLFHNGKIQLYAGDCIDVLRSISDNCIDAVVTDPPYHLTSIAKRFGGTNAAPVKGNDAFIRVTKGFMGKQWDGGDIAFRPELWVEVLRVLKPGGHIVCFGGTRTYHRLACAIEDAGFEIRDAIMWHYGSGFPKSHDVSKGIDRAAGAERELIGIVNRRGTYGEFAGPSPITAPATDAARQWQGYGTALKPATEIICLARKPLSESTVAANVLRWGTGALNIDGCRIAHSEDLSVERETRDLDSLKQGWGFKAVSRGNEGRWPANLCHDGSPEVLAGFPETGAATAAARGGSNPNPMDWGNGRADGAIVKGHDDAGGSAARYFYTAKADKDDRLNSKHPTVKPVDLMQWLVRLVCPKGATIIDPFAGTGTTGAASFIEGRQCVLIEREAEYLVDIERRMELLLSGSDERARKLAKPEPLESLPLFGVA